MPTIDFEIEIRSMVVIHIIINRCFYDLNIILNYIVIVKDGDIDESSADYGLLDVLTA